MTCVKFLVFMLLLQVALIGCATHSAVHPLSNQTKPLSDSTSTDPVVLPEYQLGFGDVIEVKFLNNERLNEIVAVRPDGRISLQRVGDLPVLGLTPSKLDSIITGVYATILQNPEITVFVRQFTNMQVYILGQVHTPGTYPIQRDMTVLQSIAAAGGTTRGAKLESVIVLRRGAGESGQGFMVDLRQYISQKTQTDNNPDLFVHSQDVIYVPKTTFAGFNDFMIALWDGTLKPVELLINAAAFRAFN